MNTTRFEKIVVDVLDSLPSQFAACLENVEVIIEPRLTAAVRRKYELSRNETVYGLYEGVPLTERSAQDMYMPTTIILFQEPLERDFPDDLHEEVRRTVLHELAHHLGISDERLEELGVY